MDLSKALETEKKYNLLELNIDGYHYWTLYRFQILCDIHEKIFSLEKAHHASSESFGRRVKEYTVRVKNLLSQRYYSAEHKDYLFVSGGRRVYRNGMYENTISDDIMECYESCTLLEYSLGGIHYKPTRTENVLYHDRIGLKALLASERAKRFCKKKYNEIYNKIEATLDGPLKEMCEGYGVEMDFVYAYTMMTEFYFQYGVYKKQYLKLLTRINPKVIIVVVYYDSTKMILIDIAKEKGIPVIELQHGTSGREHPAYNFPRECSCRYFPDYYFTFSDYWRFQAQFPIPEDRRIAVGSPYSEARKKELTTCITKGDKKIILFLSQASRGRKFSKLAVELQNLIDTEKYKIVFKMHPNEHQGWEKRYPELAKSSVTVADNTNSDLYELSASASFVIAIGNTTALYEALLFDSPGYVYYSESMAEFRELADKGLVYRFDSAEELYELIKDYKNTESNISSFWEKDSLNKMKAAIGEITNEQKFIY